MPTTKDELIYLLQNAHAGELAAFWAYDGHAKSLRDPDEKREVLNIRNEEWEHRSCVGRMLTALGSAPRKRREWLMWCIGKSISLLCRVGGWFVPMYGAGKLEQGNVLEYVVAARLAEQVGHAEMIGPLLHMAEVEWDHERYFRSKVLSHRLARWVPLWKALAPRETIRTQLATDNEFDFNRAHGK